MTQARSKKRILLFVVLGIVAIALVAFMIGLLTYNKAGARAQQYLQSDELVTVSERDGYTLFDGPGTEQLMLFYPGARVEYTAYAELLHKVAAKDIDTCAVEVPFHFAFFSPTRMVEVKEKLPYSSYIYAGHSLGAQILAQPLNKDSSKVTGMVYLSQQSTEDISSFTGKVINIRGSLDGIVSQGTIEAGRKFMPKNYQEFTIEGGNHANFADYGLGMDKPASIPAEQQVDQAVQIICDAFKN